VSRLLIVQPEAEDEITEAAIWYDERASILRENFLRSTAEAMSAIERDPEHYQKIFGKMRRIMVKGFPYGLFYVATDEQVTVLACFHSSRDPKRWQGRLR